MPKYPKPRPPFWCIKLLRTMFNYGAAKVIGNDGIALVAMIATEEDRTRYQQPARYTNHQLMAALDIKRQETLRTMRARCVEAGWLVYEPCPAGSRKASTYWTTIPAGLTDHDGLTDTDHVGQTAMVDVQPLLPTLAMTVTDKPPCSASTLARTLSVKPSPFLPVPNTDLIPKYNTPSKSSAWAELFDDEPTEPVSTPAAPTDHPEVDNGSPGVQTADSNGQAKPKKKRKPDPCQRPEIPPELETDAFRDAWQEWYDHRRRIKKPLTPKSVSRQVKQLADFGHDVAIRAIHQSIDSRWQGLFYPRGDRGPNNRFNAELAKLPED